MIHLFFRKGEAALVILPKLVEKNIKNLWIQLGINSEKAKEECKKIRYKFYTKSLHCDKISAF